MKRITRTVAVDDLRGLLDGTFGAYLAYVVDGEAEAVRVRAQRDGERWLVELPAAAPLEDGARVVLLIDDGEFYFELRGARARGTLRDAGAGQREVVPEKIVTWDYAAMRERTS
ncbi:MAG: hypothetical protein EPO22_06665 [Dehalococcoidia bacterium]|nr:MAG: hypothetical protein EPO22_06665 [Dehalococcoidia bacterium]